MSLWVGSKGRRMAQCLEVEEEKCSVSHSQPWPCEADASPDAPVLLLNGAQSICLLMSQDLREVTLMWRHGKCSHSGQTTLTGTPGEGQGWPGGRGRGGGRNLPVRWWDDHCCIGSVAVLVLCRSDHLINMELFSYGIISKGRKKEEFQKLQS